MGRLTGERRAVAAAVLAFYGFLFLLVALAPPPGWGATFGALAGIYAAGFFALVSGYFWARWFCIGLGMSGLVSGLISIWQIGMEPVLVFYGGTHGLVSLILWGSGMAAAFDGRSEWRQRFHLDDSATHRLGKAVIRAGMSLPYIVMYGLAPREGMALTIAAAGVTALAVAGLWAVLRMRTWGLAALGAATCGALATLSYSAHLAPLVQDGSSTYVVNLTALGAGAVVLLGAALIPFAGPAVRYLKG